MPSLPSPLRKQLETAIKAARSTSEAGARKALEALAVHEADPYRHMDDAQRTLRRKLRAQARQLGDAESHSRPGTYEIKHLAEKVAYDQWHRLLFARFLLENGLLISPEHEVAVTLADCEELAPSLGLKDAWAVAGRFTAAVLPEAFRADDPAAAVELPIEERNQLLRILANLPVEVFTASDSLGWTYQFWQAERKEEVNAAGNKIGADELSPVTQLFTEDYMVDFLLDNTLGAWHAGKVLAANPKLTETAESEEELRQVVALPSCPWRYLRFIKGKDGKWTPAAGTFDGWPKSAAALRALDPCMGSGHFVVAMFERLVALRLAEEKLDEAAAVAAVIRDNLFGLEIDPRCTQIGAFNLALAAWRRVGYCKLPAMNLACSGLAPNTREADWLAIAGDNQKLRNGMERLYRLFQNAPILGSLINPRAAEGDLLTADFHELQPLLEKALTSEAPTSNFKLQTENFSEAAVTARGLAKAAEILAGQFSLVATNVPYLGRGKQDEDLQGYCERVHPEGKADLATCFVERCVDFCAPSCTTALVTPQNWLFLTTYKELRRSLLRRLSWNIVARLGPGAFETISGEVVNAALVVLSAASPDDLVVTAGIDASAAKEPNKKASILQGELGGLASSVLQSDQLKNPDAVIRTAESVRSALLGEHALGYAGTQTGDSFRYVRNFWEIPKRAESWLPFQYPPKCTCDYGGREYIVAKGTRLGHIEGSAVRGKAAWGRRGVVVSQMSSVPASLYDGEYFADSGPVIVPSLESHLPAIWCFCQGPEFATALRELNPKLSVNNGYLAKVPFDLV